MCLIKMSGTLTIKRPLNRWANNWIQPGNVGPVGDVLTQERIKQSSPDFPFAYTPTFSTANNVFRGSNVQNGSIGSFTSGGLGAETEEAAWDGRRDFRTAVGWFHQDISAPDKLVTPVLDAQPSYSWRNRVATVIKARVSGQAFLPLPGGYAPEPGSVARGGQVPRITDVAAPSGVSFVGNRVEGTFEGSDPTPEAFFQGGNAPLRRAPGTRIKDEQNRRFGAGI